MSSQEDIVQHQQLLAAYRRTLAHLLQQAAQYGGEVFAPPVTVNGIAEARTNIRHIKETLQGWGVHVDDYPTDSESLSESQPLQSALLSDPPQSTWPSPSYNENAYYSIPFPTPHLRLRQALLAKMKSIWVSGFLEPSLTDGKRIILSLSHTPDAVSSALFEQYQEFKGYTRIFPSDKGVFNVFTTFNGSLLILGDSGAGKTTLLLELASELIRRAEQDVAHPIPVIFNLSSWPKSRLSLTEWLSKQLQKIYGIPLRIGTSWVEQSVLLPLLDGLDEMKSLEQEECIKAINSYRDDYGLAPLVVCSRTENYNALKERLRLFGAVLIEPLTREQIEVYLQDTGSLLGDIRTSSDNNEDLWELLQTPLFLNIVARTYKFGDFKISDLEGLTAENQRTRLFDFYIQSMYKRRNANTPYSLAQTTRWLSWISNSLIIDYSTTIDPKRINPIWLASTPAKLAKNNQDFVLGLGGGLARGPNMGLLVALVACSITGALTGLNSELPITLSVALVLALGSCLLIGLGVRRSKQLAIDMTGFKNDGLFVLDALEILTIRGPRIWLGVMTGYVISTIVVTGPTVGLVIALVALINGGLIAGLLIGLCIGIGAIAFNNAFSPLHRLILRLVIWRYDLGPFNYARFLNHATERVFLRKIGQQYIFIHRLLMEHFASMSKYRR